LREHGDGAVGEGDAGAAEAGFEIEVGAGADVFGDVGDVDLEFVAAIGALGDEDGVVEVFGGFAVDGNDGEVAEVAAAVGFFGVEMGDGAGLGEDVFREGVRQLVLADHHFDVNAEVVGIAEDFDDAANCRAGRCGPTGDLDVDDEAFQTVVSVCGCGFAAEDAMGSSGLVGRRQFLTGRNEDGLGHAFVEGDDVVAQGAIVACVVKDADDRRVVALKDTDDAALAAAVGFGRLDFDEDLVALHGAVDLVGRNEDIFSTGSLAGVRRGGSSIRSDEAEAVAMQIEPPGGEIVAGAAGTDWAGNAPVLFVELDEGAASGEAGQMFEEQAPLAPAGQAEFADKLLVSGLAAGGSGDARHQVTIGHRSRPMGLD